MGQDSVKYLAIKIDENLIWKQRISDLAIKLNWAIFVKQLGMKATYHATFNSYLLSF